MKTIIYRTELTDAIMEVSPIARDLARMDVSKVYVYADDTNPYSIIGEFIPLEDADYTVDISNDEFIALITKEE